MMSNKETRRLLAYSYAAKRAFKPAQPIVSKRQSKQPRIDVRNKRKRIQVEFKDYLSCVSIPITQA